MKCLLIVIICFFCVACSSKQVNSNNSTITINENTKESNTDLSYDSKTNKGKLDFSGQVSGTQTKLSPLEKPKTSYAVSLRHEDYTDPVVVDGTTTYRVEIINEGSEAVTHVVLKNIIPEQSILVSARAEQDNISSFIIDGRVEFSPQTIQPNDSAVFLIEVRVLEKGFLINRAIVSYDQFPKALIIEEATIAHK